MLVVSMTINMSQQCQCNIDAGGGGFEAGENVVYIKKREVSKGNGKNCQCPNNFATECLGTTPSIKKVTRNIQT